MRTSTFLAACALAAGASAAENYLGFNSGSTLADRSAKFKSDFLAEFKTAQNLQGAPGKFNAVRLYTNIQAYSESDPIEAFEAAIETKTYLLLGIWASGTDNIDKEISALQKAIEKYGSDFTDLVIGVSVGSEDLYRISETGLKNDPDGIGASPQTLVNFIKDFKKAFADTGLSKIPIGHVDTWDVWGNATNKAVIDAVDFLGVDEYPYYENGKGNDIKNAGKLFDRAYDATVAAAGGKPVWVTETGWPAVGPDWDEAVSSVANAKQYWVDVGCSKLFGKVPTFWYNLRDSNPDNKMKFAVVNDLSTTKALFDLSCPAEDESSSTTLATKPSTKTATASKGSSTESATGSDSSKTTGAASASETIAESGSTGTASGASPTASGAASGSSGSGSGSEATSGSSGSSGSSTTGAASESTPSTVAASGAATLKGAAYLSLALVAGAFALL